ncbi:FAD-dependent monooxygenase [Nitrosomonas communis]|uniref:FAD-dependent monooxygenase n=1 Tax=Nitrosomonas communis TaxID=44574 RepID=UPI003D2CEA27
MDIQWNTESIAIEQYPDYIDVTLRQLDGSTRRLRAVWTAGCDGSHSLVREKSGITFSCAPYAHHEASQELPHHYRLQHLEKMILR